MHKIGVSRQLWTLMHGSTNSLLGAAGTAEVRIAPLVRDRQSVIKYLILPAK